MIAHNDKFSRYYREQRARERARQRDAAERRRLQRRRLPIQSMRTSVDEMNEWHAGRVTVSSDSDVEQHELPRCSVVESGTNVERIERSRREWRSDASDSEQPDSWKRHRATQYRDAA